MLKSCTELHLSFSSFMNHRRHFLAQLSSELSPHLQNSRAFRSIKWRRTKRGISVNREGNVYFPFPLPPGERWIQWFRIYGITGRHQIDDFSDIYTDNNNVLLKAPCHSYLPTVSQLSILGTDDDIYFFKHCLLLVSLIDWKKLALVSYFIPLPWDHIQIMNCTTTLWWFCSLFGC